MSNLVEVTGTGKQDPYGARGQWREEDSSASIHVSHSLSLHIYQLGGALCCPQMLMDKSYRVMETASTLSLALIPTPTFVSLISSESGVHSLLK